MSKQTWTIDELTDFYSGLDNVDGVNMQRVLDWAVKNDRFIESEAKAALFSIPGKLGERLFAIFSSGHVYVWFEDFRYADGVAERDQLVASLKDLGLMKPNFDVGTVKEGKTMSHKLGDLGSGELDELLDLFGDYCL